MKGASKKGGSSGPQAAGGQAGATGNSPVAQFAPGIVQGENAANSVPPANAGAAGGKNQLSVTLG